MQGGGEHHRQITEGSGRRRDLSEFRIGVAMALGRRRSTTAGFQRAREEGLSEFETYFAPKCSFAASIARLVICERCRPMSASSRFDSAFSSL